jgi:hypothetical protein
MLWANLSFTRRALSARRRRWCSQREANPRTWVERRMKRVLEDPRTEVMRVRLLRQLCDESLGTSRLTLQHTLEKAQQILTNVSVFRT